MRFNITQNFHDKTSFFLGDTYYQESGYSAATHPAPMPSYHEYRADSRDRDSRTFRPDSQSQSSHYQPVHDRQWDHRNHRSDNRGRE